MTQRIKAQVYKHRALRNVWVASAFEEPQTTTTGEWTFYTQSWPSAMQAAHLMLADLDRLLMNEVPESRSSRRTGTSK